MTEEEVDAAISEFGKLVAQLRRTKRSLEISSSPAVQTLLRNDAKDLIARFIRRHFREILAHKKDPRFSDAKNIAMAIQPWYPLFGVAGSEKAEWDQFFLEMWTVGEGDEPKILRPPKRRKGESRRPFQLASSRLSALEWDAFLQARGLQPMQYRALLELAYAAEWDTIRQWRRAAIPNVMPREFIDARISYAAEGGGDFLRYPDFHEPLRESGAKYRELIGLPILTAAEFRHRAEAMVNGSRGGW